MTSSRSHVMHLTRREWHAVVVGGLVMGPLGRRPQASSGAARPDMAHQAAREDRAQAGKWRMLFDGTSMQAWRGYKSDTLPAGWRVADGVLSKDGAVPDIISRDQFDDFDLEIDWRIGAAGNSGIFYRGTEEYNRIYWSAPEYQLLDDEKAADNKTRLTCAGACYALYPSPAGHLKPVGQWNQTRIVARGPHVEHWLNGIKLLEFEQGSAAWNAKVAASKFKDWPNFGTSMRGHLAIQGDHEGELAFRTIRIRPG